MTAVVFFARVPKALQPWRDHLREGLAGLAVRPPDGWQDVVERHRAAERPNTRFGVTDAENAAIERLVEESGVPRWAVLTAALESAARGRAEEPPPAVAVPASRLPATFRVPKGLRGWRSELERGLHFAESGGDWAAPQRDYRDDEYITTRFVVSHATRERIRDLARRRRVPQWQVVTVALNELAGDPALAGLPDPTTAIARLWPPPLSENAEDVAYRQPPVRRRPAD